MIDDRLSLPQLEHRPFLTDSGLETKLIFIDGIELPEFAAFEGSDTTATASTSSTRTRSRFSST